MAFAAWQNITAGFSALQTDNRTTGSRLIITDLLLNRSFNETYMLRYWKGLGALLWVFAIPGTWASTSMQTKARALGRQKGPNLIRP